MPRLIAFDRAKVRQRFEQRFSAERMAADYVTVYRELIASSAPIDDEALSLPPVKRRSAQILRPNFA